MERSSGRGPAAEVFRVALRLGLTSFGGPIAHLGYFRREYVERRRWLDEVAFADLIALCQSLPGPASSQLGIAIGMRRAGFVGGLAAWLGFTAPSAIALIGFGLLASGGDLANAGWVHGLKLAAVAVVGQAVISMGRTLTPDLPRRLAALVAAGAALLVASHFAQVAIIVAGAVFGRAVLRPTLPSTDAVELRTFSRRTGVAALAVFTFLLVGLPAAAAVGPHPIALFSAFFLAGALVFGGGHVVLPLLHAGVVAPGWVAPDPFLAGYAAAQAVPGPLFSLAAFLGTVAVLPPNGIAGALFCLVAIYLPSFLLLVAVLPFWERLRRMEGLRSALAGTNAAVVGLLLAAWITPVGTAAVASVLDLFVAGLAFAAVTSRRVPVLAVVASCAVLGQGLAVLRLA